MGSAHHEAELPVICRCEEVSLAAVADALAAGCCSVDEVKKVTRAGMGFCQGRSCRHAVEQILENRGIDLAACAVPRSRTPVRPVSLSQVAATPDQPGWPTNGTSSHSLWKPEELPKVADVKGAWTPW